MASISTFQSLRKLLNSSLDNLEAELKASNFPELGTETLHPVDDPTFTPNEKFYRARMHAIACLAQLQEAVQSPAERLMNASLAAHTSAALQTVIQANIADLLPADNKAMHVQKLAEAAHMDPVKLEKILRALASQSFFSQKDEGLYSNNRASLLLKNGSPIRDFVGFHTWQILTSAHRQASTYTSPQTAMSWDPLDSPTALAYDLRKKGYKDVWEFLKVEHPEIVVQFGRAMTAFGMVSAKAVLRDFPWSSLAKGTKLVDVGGGEGALLIEIMRAFPGHFVGEVQDRAEVVTLAKANFEKNLPDAVSSVKFEPHDFFNPQPQTEDNTIYLVRWIIHDHPDDLSIKILQRLRDALRANSRILIVDTILQPSTPSKGSAGGDFFEPPLLTSGGEASRLTSLVDLQMMHGLSGRERTEEEFKHLLQSSGLSCAKIWHVRGPHGIVEACLPQS